jgi:fucose permease
VRFKTLPIYFAFFVMGFEDAVGTFVGFAKVQFDLSPFIAGLLPFFTFLAYGLFAVPIGVLADRKGKKFVMVTFLFLTALGSLIPTISVSEYWYLLLGIFFLGAGNAGLQVAGNPIMRDVSAPGRYSRNLTFAQFIKSVGSNTGPYVTTLLVATFGLAWYQIFPMYFIVAVITMIMLMFLKVEERPDEQKAETASIKSSLSLLFTEKYVFLMVLGIFLYVGAEIGLNTWISTHLRENFGLDLENMATLGLGFFLTALSIGRFLGAFLHHFISPKTHFVITSVMAFVGVLGVFANSATVVIISLVIAGLAFGNIFPTIFSILIEHMPHRSAELSGLMVMAIFGGAVVPALMGAIAEISIRLSFVLPAVISLYILILAFITRNKELHLPDKNRAKP